MLSSYLTEGVTMSVKCLVIGGTLAPSICERTYYGKTLATIEQLEIDTSYTSIRLLGLGDIEGATDHISRLYFEGDDSQYVVVGHSQGAVIAGLLAMRYPTRILTVVALAGPYKGTVWTDPQSLIAKAAIEALDQVTRGGIKLKPKLPRSRLSKLIGKYIPIVDGLSSDSTVLKKLKLHLETQTVGPVTHSVIATDDRFVIPSRSAHPQGLLVKKYLAAHPDIHHHLHGRIPEEIELLAFKAGHIGMVNDPGVLELLAQIIQSELLSYNSRQ